MTLPVPAICGRREHARCARLVVAGVATVATLSTVVLQTSTAHAELRTSELMPAEEKQHRAKMDEALAPLLNASISDADAKLLRDAKKAIDRRKIETAASLRSKLSTPLAAKMVDWYRLRSGHGDVDEIQAFLNDNPLWPNQWRMRDAIDVKLFEGKKKPQWVVDYYANVAPEKPMALGALAVAKSSLGDKDTASRLAAKAWRTGDLDKAQELAFVKKLGHLLTPADHKWRFDRLITDRIRWRTSRNKRAAVLSRQISRLEANERRKAKARLAVFNRKKNAGKLLAALPAEKKPDWGLVFQRVEYLRRSKQVTKAAKLLLGAPTTLEDIVNPDGWWAERRANAYEALDRGKSKLAYELVRDAGPLSVNPLKDQQFLAGWLALRYLGATDKAIKHFAAMKQAADGPLSRAKSAYWLARAHEAAGNKAAAKSEYEASAKQFDTFHGLLSRQQLNGGQPMALELSPPALATETQVQRFVSLDAAMAGAIAVKAKLGRSVSRLFLANLAAKMETEGEVALAAHLTQKLGDTQQSLRIGKAAIARGMNLIYYSYPVHALPKYKPLRKPPETAFLLGIARQESEFNTHIRSGAGARGILQVMPITARHVCRDYKIKCNIGRLQLDESYNTMIASAYTADRMAEFGGSYVLGLAGYNAGPGRARQWIKRFGDPRSARIDAIDWIERMPFRETRKYATKVLSNIQIYRARLGESEQPLRVMQDLARAKKGNVHQSALQAPGANIARTQ